MGRPEDWAFVSGWVSARAERLMDRRAILALLDAGGPEEVALRLRSSLLFAEASGVPLADQADRGFAAIATEIAAMAPDRRIGDLFLMDRRWHRFREFAKAMLAGEGDALARRSARPSAETELLRECWEGRTEDERLRPFVRAAEAVRAAAAVEDLPGLVDRVCDAHEASALVATAGMLDGERLFEWVTDWVRLRGALAFFRARRLGWNMAAVLEPWRAVGLDSPELMGVALGKDDELISAWERLGVAGARELVGAGPSGGDDVLVRLARRIESAIEGRIAQAQGIPFGPERVFEFLWRLRREATAVKIVLASLACGMPKEKAAADLFG